MSKRYKCVTSWVRHSKGEIIPEHEYVKIPHEIKISGAFVEIVPDLVVPVAPSEPTSEVIFESPAVDDSPKIVSEEPLDPVPTDVIIDPFFERKNKRK